MRDRRRGAGAMGIRPPAASGSGLGRSRAFPTSSRSLRRPGPGPRCWPGLGAAPPPQRSRAGSRIGGSSHPYPGEEVCGDAWAYAATSRDGRTVLVADGLGHGGGGARRHGRGPIFARPRRDADRDRLLEHPRRAAADARRRYGGGCLDRPERVVRFAGIGNIAGAMPGAVDAPHGVAQRHGRASRAARPANSTYPFAGRARCDPALRRAVDALVLGRIRA